MAEYIANFQMNRNTLEYEGELSQNQLHADLIVDYRPSKTSQLINDSGYITIADVPTKLSELVNDTGFITASALIPLENDIVEIESDILGLQNSKVDKITGKGLSTNDFTDVLKTKLEGIEAGAEVNKVNSVNGQTGDVVIEIPDSATWGNITGTLSNQTDLQQALNGKQPTISDLETIRTGAGKGETAVQPNDNITQLVNNAGYITGITSSDVTTALGYTPYNSTNPNNYITNSALTNYVTTNTNQIITGQKTFKRTESQFQDSIARFVSTYVSSTQGWRGRIVIGAKDYTFIIGTYNGMAAIGGHKFSDSSTETGASWSDVYFQPDGDKAVYIGGWNWTQNSGWFKVQNNASNTGGKVQVNTGTISSANWKDVAYKGENVKDFDFTQITGYNPSATQVLKNVNGTLQWVTE